MPIHESENQESRVFAIPSNGARRLNDEQTAVVKSATVDIVGTIRNVQGDLWYNILVSCLVTIARHFDDPEDIVDQIAERTKQSLCRLNN